MDDVTEMAVGDEGIRLGQLLKYVGVVDSGAQVKALLADGDVRVNGEHEDRRGRHLVAGDVVEISTAAGVERIRLRG